MKDTMCCIIYALATYIATIQRYGTTQRQHHSYLHSIECEAYSSQLNSMQWLV